MKDTYLPEEGLSHFWYERRHPDDHPTDRDQLIYVLRVQHTHVLRLLNIEGPHLCM